MKIGIMGAKGSFSEQAGEVYLELEKQSVGIQEYVDTAAAAKALHDGELPDTTAVIAPRRCADLYGLEILEESIQELKFNYTTFVVAVKEK